MLRNSNIPKRTWRCVIALVLMLSVGACGKSEPTYSGISITSQNYLPYNLEGFSITDKYGNKASGGGDDPPGGGGGSLTCCYKLKGVRFTVKWNYYDADQWTMSDSHMQHAETTVLMPPSKSPGDVGARILEVHFFPDRHVELQFPGGLLDDSRIPIVDVSRWMTDHYREKLAEKFDDNWAEEHRRISRVVAAAWLKYGLVNLNDLEQYTYFDLLINERFDSHPEIQRLLQITKNASGELAKHLQTLAPSVLSELKSNKFAPVPVPAIPDGFLPPPLPKGEKDA